MAISQYPSGGYNFQSKTPYTVTNQVSTTATTTVVTVTGSGLLTGITQVITGTSGLSADLVIILDGLTIYNDSTGIDPTDNAVVALSFMHKYNTSMTIQHKNNSTSNQLRTIVTYITNT